MRDLEFMEKAHEAMSQISGQGAFLTVRSGGNLNTMTIGWSSIGFLWGRPLLMVAVRDTRYTYELIENAPDFTVTIPWQDMSRELEFCGTKSGRNICKFEACGLMTQEARSVHSPIIQCKGLFFECRTVFKMPMDPANLDREIKENAYPARDFHTFYFGEIVECYETD